MCMFSLLRSLSGICLLTRYYLIPLSLSLSPSPTTPQLELALGSFPYGKWSTIFEQLNAVVNGPPPKLPVDGRYSKEIQEFASAWWVIQIVKLLPIQSDLNYPNPFGQLQNLSVHLSKELG